jgi:site-specific recombinase XerD
MQDQIPPVSQVPVVADQRLSIDHIITLWLESKKRRTGSDGTKEMYEYAIQRFREMLKIVHLDLDSDPIAVSLGAQRWASMNLQNGQQGNTVSEATFNQRLAILSSFYRFARKRRFLMIENPIEMLDRSKIEAYAHAKAMEREEVKEGLSKIDRTSIEGKRDYALLSVTLHTGRRAAEIASLQWQHLKVKQVKKRTVVVLYFARLKGGKTRTDELEVETSSALLDYLHAFYGAQLGRLDPDKPIWVSLATNTRGNQLTTRSLEYICEKYFGEGKFHMLRSTFAVAMEEAGAKVSDIQYRLAHESLTTTGRYLAKLQSSKNAHAGKLEEMFGIKGSETREGEEGEERP